MHATPEPHCGPVPHWHAPPTQPSAWVELQVVQAAPPVPQALSVLPVMQVEPLQHPLGQLVASHTQLLLTHRCPVAHWELLPHRQLPDDEQLLARVLEQVVHELPLVPQSLSVGGLMQLPLSQHPVAQLTLSHTQLPETQCRPTEHCELLPQRQVPELPHALARTGSQAKQAPPSMPHCAAVVGVMQVEPLQQPPGQLAALHPVHTWLVQVPAPHDAQAAPPVPHSAVVVPARHTLPAQQPVGQLVASHTHTPPEHTCPVAQEGPEPQAHAPLVQRSALASQAAHAAPALPHEAEDCDEVLWQVLPLQHPEGQLVALHTQVPPWHVCPLTHALDAPHRHTPALQVLVMPEHGAHAAPPVPHVAALCDAC